MFEQVGEEPPVVHDVVEGFVHPERLARFRMVQRLRQHQQHVLEIALGKQRRVLAGKLGHRLPAAVQGKHHWRRIGGDVVGMSTIPEVLVAKHMELPVFVASVVSNQSYPPESIKEVSLEDVIGAVEKAEPKLTLIVKALLKEID